MFNKGIETILSKLVIGSPELRRMKVNLKGLCRLKMVRVGVPTKVVHLEDIHISEASAKLTTDRAKAGVAPVGHEQDLDLILSHFRCDKYE